MAKEIVNFLMKNCDFPKLCNFHKSFLILHLMCVVYPIRPEPFFAIFLWLHHLTVSVIDEFDRDLRSPSTWNLLIWFKMPKKHGSKTQKLTQKLWPHEFWSHFLVLSTDAPDSTSPAARLVAPQARLALVRAARRDEAAEVGVEEASEESHRTNAMEMHSRDTCLYVHMETHNIYTYIYIYIYR